VCVGGVYVSKRPRPDSNNIKRKENAESKRTGKNARGFSVTISAYPVVVNSARIRTRVHNDVPGRTIGLAVRPLSRWRRGRIPSRYNNIFAATFARARPNVLLQQ